MDVVRAIETGKRRRRVRRLGLGVGAASVSGPAEATGINDQGKISGQLLQVRVTKPVVWPSTDAEPVELSLPEGVRYGRASDIDEDGTVVGSIGDRQRTAYVWYPDGTAQPLPAPVVAGQPATDFDARRVRNGWVTGSCRQHRAAPGSDGTWSPAKPRCSTSSSGATTSARTAGSWGWIAKPTPS